MKLTLEENDLKVTVEKETGDLVVILENMFKPLMKSIGFNKAQLDRIKIVSTDEPPKVPDMPKAPVTHTPGKAVKKNNVN